MAVRATAYSASKMVPVRSRAFCVFALSLPLLLGGSAWASAGSGTSIATLTTAREVHGLSPAEAQLHHPVHLRGWVTYYDAYADAQQAFMFLHDATGDIFVSLPKSSALSVRQGTPVEVTGVSDAGEFAPIVAHGQTRIVDGPAREIAAPPIDLPLLLVGDYDARFVDVEGVVQGVFGSERNMIFKLATRNGVVRATTPREPDIDYTRLIDAQIRVKANIAPQFNHRRQVTGAHLFFQSMADVRVERPAPPDPFAGPLHTVDDLTKIASGLGVLNSIHLRGRVILQWPGRLLCVEDGSGGLCVETSQRDTVAIGRMVDVTGFPSMEDTTAGLVEARFRPIGATEPVQPTKTSAVEILGGKDAGALVSIEGKLIGTDQYLNSELKDWTLTMESGGRIFRVLIPSGLRQLDWHIPGKGSVLRLTGVCLPELDPHHQEVVERESGYDSFRVLLRTPADVAILQTPSWWNGPRVLYVLLAGAAVCMAGCVWVILLRRRVAEQTRVIRSSEERFRHLAEHDGLTGLANRRLLNERLTMALDRAKSGGSRLAILMMDLDKFKQVNDSFGHHMGDRMLCAAAARIAGCVGPADTVARTGGDEFVVLLPALRNAEEAEMVAAKIVAAIAAPLEVDGQSIPMSASIGICAYPDGGCDIETLLRNCDTSLYGAKALGRNGWQRFAGLKLHPAEV